MTIGALICWFRGNHKWRRLRMGEWKPDRINTAHRICSRCGAVRAVRPRKATQ